MKSGAYRLEDGRIAVDCPLCGGAARIDSHGRRLAVRCFAGCAPEEALAALDREQLLGEVRALQAPPSASSDNGSAESRQGEAGRRGRTTAAAAVEREEVEWLWPDRVPLAMLTLLVGDPGLGKSLLTVDLAARVSQDGADVLMLTAEDAKGAIVRPRLEAAEADLERVHFFEMTAGGVEDGTALPDDLEWLDGAVRDTGARLVVVDPLMAHLPAAVNSWRDQSVRTALAPLHRLAEERRCAVVVVAHLNKGQGTDPLYRTGGSVGIPAAVRSALLLARDPEDSDGDEGARRVLAHFKCNVAPLAPTLLYAVESAPEVAAARLRSLGESNVERGELLTQRSSAEHSERDDAVEFLRAELADGPRSTREVNRAAGEVGISEITLKRARRALGVSAEKDGRHWILRLPEGDHGPVTPFRGSAGDPLRANPLPERDSGGRQTPPAAEGDQGQEVIPFEAEGHVATLEEEPDIEPAEGGERNPEPRSAAGRELLSRAEPGADDDVSRFIRGETDTLTLGDPSQSWESEAADDFLAQAAETFPGSRELRAGECERCGKALPRDPKAGPYPWPRCLACECAVAGAADPVAGTERT